MDEFVELEDVGGDASHTVLFGANECRSTPLLEQEMLDLVKESEILQPTFKMKKS